MAMIGVRIAALGLALAVKSSGPRASFAYRCCKKPNPMISRSGSAYQLAGTGSGEIERRSRFMSSVHFKKWDQVPGCYFVSN